MGPLKTFAIRGRQSQKLCHMIREGCVSVSSLDIYDPGSFTSTQLIPYDDYKCFECPLYVAALVKPMIALKMLAMGADIHDCQLGTALLLQAACKRKYLPRRLQLFRALLEKGADPVQPLFREMGETIKEKPFRHSLMAYLVNRNLTGLPFIQELHRQSLYDDGRIWPLPDGEPVLAEDYARSLGHTSLAQELMFLRRCSGLRLAWIAVCCS